MKDGPTLALKLPWPVTGSLVALMVVITLPGPIHNALSKIAWIPLFPGVETTNGFLTPAGAGNNVRFLLHPARHSFCRFDELCTLQKFSLLPAGRWNVGASKNLRPLLLRQPGV